MSSFRVFFKENVRYPVWTCGDPISLIQGTRFSILRTRIWSLKRLKKTLSSFVQNMQLNLQMLLEKESFKMFPDF